MIGKKCGLKKSLLKEKALTTRPKITLMNIQVTLLLL